MPDLSLADLQRHVERRAKKNGLRGKLSPATIRKEIVTLRTAWNWAVPMGFLTGRFPNKGLHYPRFTEKPPFMVWEEVERRVISACASKGIDQRLIDEWTGHATDEQRKRYRHLYPSTQQAAMVSVFGE